MTTQQSDSEESLTVNVTTTGEGPNDAMLSKKPLDILTWARGDENVILIQNSEGEQIAGLSDRQPADAASAVAMAEDLSADFARKLGMKPNNVEKTISFARDGKYRSTLVFKVDDK